MLGLGFAATACTVTDGGSDKATPCQDTAIPVAWTDSTDMGTPESRFCGPWDGISADLTSTSGGWC